MVNKSPAVTTAQDAVRASQLLDLMVAGVGLNAAAKQLHMSFTKAKKLYHDELKRYFEEHAGERQELVGRELRKLDVLEKPFFRKALDGDEKAMDRVLSIMKARREILGLDAAAKVSVEVTRVDDAISQIVRVIDGRISDAEEVEVAPLRRLEAG